MIASLCTVMITSAQMPSTAAQRFDLQRNYLCITRTAMYSAPALRDQGIWSDPPQRFKISFEECTIWCRPQKSREKPISLLLVDAGTNWPAKYEGYHDEPGYHSPAGGSVVLSGTDLTLTRSLTGTVAGEDSPAAFTLNAECYPIE